MKAVRCKTMEMFDSHQALTPTTATLGQIDTTTFVNAEVAQEIAAILQIGRSAFAD